MVNAVHPEGRDDHLRQQQCPRLDRRWQHVLRVQPELHQAVRDAADHVQGLLRCLRRSACPGAGHGARHGDRQQQDLDVPHQVRREVRGRVARHLAGRQVRGGADVRPHRAAEWPDLLHVAAGRERGDLPGPVQGPGEERDGPDRDRHARPDDGRLPPQAAVRELQLRGRVPADRPGAAGQGQGHELPAPPAVHRPVHVPELPAQQAVHAGAEPAVEPVLGPPGQAAPQQDRRQPERQRQRHRQPAAGRRHPGGPGGKRRPVRGPGPDPLQARRSRRTPTTRSTASCGSTTSTPRWRR